MRTQTPAPEMYSTLLASAKRRAIGRGVAETPIIHIVDDDESMREVRASFFRSETLAARTYASVDAFLSARRPDAPGCLILDVRLPGMSGLDFQAQLAKRG
jgi:FixJ family two-component response regulator